MISDDLLKLKSSGFVHGLMITNKMTLLEYLLEYHPYSNHNSRVERASLLIVWERRVSCYLSQLSHTAYAYLIL